MPNTRRKLPAFRIVRCTAFFVLAYCCVAGYFALLNMPSYEAATTLTVLTIACCAFLAAFIFEVYWLVRGKSAGEESFSLAGAGRALAFVFFWSVVLGLILATIVYLAFQGEVFASAPFLAMGLVFLAVLLLAISGATQFIRQRRTLLILSHLEKAVRLEIGLPRMILAAADSESGVLRVRLLSLHDYLDRGESVSQALADACPEVPQSFLRAINAGEQMNCLAHVLSNLIRGRSGGFAYREGRDNPPGVGNGVGIYWAYPVFIVSIVCLIMLVVLPKYQAIFRDFQIELPPATKMLLAITYEFNSAGAMLILLLLTLAPLGWALARLFPSFLPNTRFGGTLADYVLWWMPVSRGYIRDRGMADLCDLLNVATETGRPFDESLRQAAEAQANVVMRRRATVWARGVAEGQPIYEAARYAKMPELFVGMLATARDNAGLAQVLSFLWRHYEYRFNRIRTILRAAYMPLIVFSLGSVVAFIGAALMEPMAALSRHIAGQIAGGGF